MRPNRRFSFALAVVSLASLPCVLLCEFVLARLVLGADAAATSEQKAGSAESQAEALFNRGNELSTKPKPDFDEAIRCYQKALELRPDYTRSWNNMGTAHFRKGDFREALRCYRKAVELKPEYYEAWNNMGNAYNCTREFDESIRCYQKTVELKPDYVDAWCNMGLAYYYKANFQEALRCYRKAAEIEPGFSGAWYGAAVVSARLGDAQGAVANLRKAIELNPESREKARTDKDFDALRDNPDFQALVGGGK